MGKRVFDLLGASLLLLICGPFIAAIALVVRVALGKPVLFRQLRPGLRGRPFELLKFRTMLNVRDEAGVPLPDSRRLTSFGKALRKTSLDELPELINVLRGEMSLVGPRPLLMDYMPLYDQEQAHRHDVKPGITGWAQVNGRNALSWEEKFAHDLWYVANHSLALDLRILCMTVKKVVLADGISEKGSATAEPFRGNSR